jgi:hypothetical protein
MLTVIQFALLYASATVYADQQIYDDTSAIKQNQDLLVSNTPVVDFKIRTSNVYLAGTTDIISATIVGEFSSSGPHGLGSFDVGSAVDVSITTDRNVGKLNKLIFANNGTDGWLPLYVQCVYENEWYEFNVPRQWISTHPTEELVEPNTQLLDEIQSFPIMHLKVATNTPVYPVNP